MVRKCGSQILVITKVFFLGNNSTKCKFWFYASFYIRKSLSLRYIWGLRSSHFWDVTLCSLVGRNNISEESAVTTAYSRGTQDFQKCKSHLKVATQHLDAWATLHLGFVHLWYATSLAHAIRSAWDRPAVKLTPGSRTISVCQVASSAMAEDSVSSDIKAACT